MSTDKEKLLDAKDPDIVLHAAGFDSVPIPKPQDTFFAITGHESQVLTVKLASGEQVRGEPGTMFYLTPGVVQSASCDNWFARCCTGEECCTVNMANNGSNGGLDAYAALTPNFPTAKVVPVNLSAPEVGGKLICQKGMWRLGLCLG